MAIGLLVDMEHEPLMDLERGSVSTTLNKQGKKTLTRQTRPRLQGVDEKAARGFCLGRQLPCRREWPCMSGHSVYSRA